MKISIAQIKVIPGQPSINLSTIERFVNEAKENQADIIVFPEMCVGGYFMSDRYLDHDYLVYLASFNEKIKNLSVDIGIIWGNVSIDRIDGISRGRDGRPALFNTAFFAYNKQFVKRESGRYDGIYVKHLNPDYRVFDDSRFFLSGLEIMRANNDLHSEMLKPFIFSIHGQTTRISLEICEDLWDDDYPFKATDEILKGNPDLLINISSSPWTLDKEKARARHLAKKAQVTTIYVNAVSQQDIGKNILLLDGGSMVFAAGGKEIAAANDRFKEEHLLVDLAHPILNSHQYSHTKLFDALIFALQSFDEAMFKGKVKWIIGLSGGIDSALNASLLTYAFGRDRVLAYNLPSRYNSVSTISNASLIASALGIELVTKSIEPLIQATKNLFEHEVSVEVEENIHARLRGHLLSSFAQDQKGVICNNGNKLEIALGYCTLYGDTIGAISPLGDLTKMQINYLAEEMNSILGREVIPSNLIARIRKGIPFYELHPTAELKTNQIDPMKWGYHDWLLNRLMSFPTRDISQLLTDYEQSNLPEEVVNLLKYYHLDNEEAFIADLKWFLKTLDNSYFKRIQMPPIVTISRGSFGFDYRETQAKIEEFIEQLK